MLCSSRRFAAQGNDEIYFLIFHIYAATAPHLVAIGVDDGRLRHGVELAGERSHHELRLHVKRRVRVAELVQIVVVFDIDLLHRKVRVATQAL